MSALRTLVPVLFFLASPALAGWSMTQVTTTSGGDAGAAAATTQKVSMEGTSARIEMVESANPMMEQGTYLLIQDGGKKVFMVNPKKRTYARFDVMAMGMGMDAMGGAVEMKIEDPKMEKLLEEPGGEMLGLPTTHYRYHTTYTMVMSMPMGMKTGMATDIVEDLWTTPAIEVGGAGQVLASLGGGGMLKEIEKLPQKEKATPTGLPLRQVTVTQSKSTAKGMMGRMMGRGGDGTTTITMEVKDLVQAALPASTFQIPAGYSETEILQRGPAMPDLGEGEN